MITKNILVVSVITLSIIGCSLKEKEKIMNKKTIVDTQVKSFVHDIKTAVKDKKNTIKHGLVDLAKDEIDILINSKKVKSIYKGYTAINDGTPEDRLSLAIKNDHYGDSANKIMYLDQGWTSGDSLWFYTTTQGSELMPYDIFINLEQYNNNELFKSNKNISKYRYLAQKKSKSNPDSLPVGFVKNNNSIGFTCAACHTSQINYKGTGIRIDGGPTMANFVYFLEDLEKSMESTKNSPTKLERFVKKIQESNSLASKEKILENLQKSIDKITVYNRRNYTKDEYGFARVDAVGRIYNQVLEFVSGPNEFNTPNAPASYPFLWDTPRHDYVQWLGITGNAGPGSLGRNAGEVVGVFGDIKVKNYHSSEMKLLKGYKSTVRTDNLVEIEEWLRQLQSPLWPNDILPKIDNSKLADGKKIYDKNCMSCHTTINRTNPNRKIIAQMYGYDEVKTDYQEINNAISYTGKTGILEGAKRPVLGGVYGKEEALVVMLTDLVEGVIFNNKKELLKGMYFSEINGNGLKDGIKHGVYPQDKPFGSYKAYKARPLNGIWATAPYLHNGSIPTLYDLLLPENQRPATFAVGQMEFDPIKVGFIHNPENKNVASILDTSKIGNSNKGHTYGTNLSESDRMSLLEYLKSL